MIKIERVSLSLKDSVTIWPLSGLFSVHIGSWGGNGVFETGYDYRNIYISILILKIVIGLNRQNGKEPTDFDMV